MKPVVFDREASDELHAAAGWYEERRAGLGDEFMEEVEQAKERIGRTPQAFPYTIFFLEQEGRVWIAAVAHQKRRPGYWSGREPG